MTTRVLEEPPGSVPLMLKAALPAIPGVGSLPGLRKTATELPDLTLALKDVPVDAGHVAAYAGVCGFPRKDTLPVPYLHMLAFPLHMAMLTDSSFPYGAMGMVHLENTINQHRLTTAKERFNVSVTATNLRPHAKGKVFDMVTQISVDGEVVWDEISTYLSRGNPHEDAPAGLALAMPDGPGMEWKLGADLGRRYGSVSGDRNPIHLYAVTAKAFGFQRQIAHGMWSKARCIAAIENRLPEQVKVAVAFKTPILLPATVRFTTERTDQGQAFGLSNPRNDAPHLAGVTRPL